MTALWWYLAGLFTPLAVFVLLMVVGLLRGQSTFYLKRIRDEETVWERKWGES